jgi:hypothetical protein
MAAFVTLAYFTMGAGSAGFFGTGLTGSLVGATAFYAGAQVINRVLPPAQAAQMSPATNSAQPTYSLSGGRNSARLWESMSLVLGQPYMVPDLAGQPWTYFSGEDQYLTQIFHGGINLQRLDSLRIGQTAIESFDGVSIRAKGLPESPWSASLPANSVDSIAGALLDAPSGTGAWVTRTTSVGTIQIGIDLEMTLFGVNGSNGAYESRAVQLDVQYCAHGTNAWAGVPTGTGYQEQYISGYDSQYDGDGVYTNVPIYAWRTVPYADGTAKYINATSKPLRVSISLPVTSGQYDVRIRKATANETSTSAQNVVTWTQLKSFQPDLGSYPGQSLVALTIKASGQLTGNLDQLNWVATARPTPHWNGSAWVTATNKSNGLSNPGVQLLQLARGIYDENGKLIAGLGWADSRIDIESIKSFTVWCTTKQFTFDAIIQQTMSIGDLMDAIAYAGMGSISWPGGKLGVQWLADDAPIEGVINMGNIKAKSFSVSYAASDRADEIEYGYFDASANNQWNSLRVQSPAVTTPINTARLSNMGITSEAQAAVLARYAMAQNIYMSKAITFEQDLEFLTYKRGTVLALSHDMTQWGYSGRIQSAVNNSGAVTLTLDDAIPAPASGSAYIGLRLVGELQYRIFSCAAFTGSTRVVTLAGAWPIGVALPGANGQPMDALWIYDFKATPGQKVVVSKIEPADNQGGAKVTVTPLPDEFWPYVFNGAYTPAPNRSLLVLLPTASDARVSEQLGRQGNTYYVDLNLAFNVSGPFDSAEVWGSINSSSLRLIGATKSKYFSWRGGLGETWNIEVRPRNALGQVGSAARVSYLVIGLTAPPSDVQGLSVNVASNGVRITWAQPTDADYSETAVRIGSSWAAGVEVLRKSATSHLLGWQHVGELKVWAKHYDTTGNESVNAVSSTVVIRAPSKVQMIAVEMQANALTMQWLDAKTDQPILRYEYFTGDQGALLSSCGSWGSAGSDGRSDLRTFRTPGAKQVYVVAYDVALNASEPATFVVNSSMPPDFVLASDYYEDWQTSEMVNTTIIGGAAGQLLMPVADQTWGDHFSSRGWANAQAQVDAGYPLWWSPAASSGYHTERHDCGRVIAGGVVNVTVLSASWGSGASSKVSIRVSADAAVWSGWIDATAYQASTFRYVEVRYAVTSDGHGAMLVDDIHVDVRVSSITETAVLALISSDGVGTFYATTKSFIDIQTVQATALNSTSIARINTIIKDDVAPFGVYVQAWDTNLNRVNGSVSLTITGI